MIRQGRRSIALYCFRLPRKGEHSARIRTAQKKTKTHPRRKGWCGRTVRPTRWIRPSPQTQVGSAVIVPIITLSMLIAVFSAMVWALATR
jgi:hypothetical protein